MSTLPPYTGPRTPDGVPDLEREAWQRDAGLTFWMTVDGASSPPDDEVEAPGGELVREAACLLLVLLWLGVLAAATLVAWEIAAWLMEAIG